ncbi:MAG: aldehyde dehydrogenase family protein [Planctomycetota bacterium]
MDRDLASIQDARDLLRRAHHAQLQFARTSQADTDRVVEAMARAATDHARELAELAVRETGMGRVESKTLKNLFVSERLHGAYRNARTCGVIREDLGRGIIEVAEPVGVVAGIIPTTNPTSTAIFKVLIAVKGRNAIVLSPHPRAERCIQRSCEILARAATAAGAPADLILCMSAPTIEGTQELMRNALTSVVVATGGPGVVRAAYSSGKPAFGVGPGNPPVFVHRSANLPHAARCLVDSQSFDYGTICSSEQSLVVERVIAEPFRAALRAECVHFCDPREAPLLENLVQHGDGSFNTAIVGQAPTRLAELAGFSVDARTRILIAPGRGVGREFPLSREKLAPILAWYEVDDWRAGCELCIELIRYGGEGHTMGIYARDPEVVMAFGLEKPVARLIVNGPTTQGSVGYSTELDPSMTLGCGAMGGNITSDNIGPRHLINVKRIAYPTATYFREVSQPCDAADLAPVFGGGLPSALAGARAGEGVRQLLGHKTEQQIGLPAQTSQADAASRGRALHPAVNVYGLEVAGAAATSRELHARALYGARVPPRVEPRDPWRRGD